MNIDTKTSKRGKSGIGNIVYDSTNSFKIAFDKLLRRVITQITSKYTVVLDKGESIYGFFGIFNI
jgi:hypothetical protein